MGGGQVLTACVGEEAGAGLAEPLSGQREQDGRNAQIAPFAKSWDLRVGRKAQAAYASGKAAVRRRCGHQTPSNGRGADEADSKIIRSNCRPSEWVGRAQSRRSKTRSSHPLWASILTCTICIRRTIGTSPLASFRFRYVRNAGK